MVLRSVSMPAMNWAYKMEECLAENLENMVVLKYEVLYCSADGTTDGKCESLVLGD